MNNPFFFITGCPRSGTTLLERILNAHPQVAILMGSKGIVQRFERREGLTPEGFVTPQMAEEARFPGFVNQEEFSGFVRGVLRTGQPVSYASLISLIFDRYGKAEGKPFVGYKVESTGHKVQYGVPRVTTLHTLWPEAKIIHLIRDGRDLCLSVNGWRRAPSLAERFSTWKEEPVTTAALWWEWQVRQKREDGIPLGPGLYHEIRYEALASRPGAECKALCQFLGLPYDDAMLRFHEGRERDEPGLDAKHAWRPVTLGLRDWRKEMSREELECFEAVAGDLLDELGYPRGLSRLPAQAPERAARVRSLFEGRPLPEHW